MSEDSGGAKNRHTAGEQRTCQRLADSEELARRLTEGRIVCIARKSISYFELNCT
ncbi:MAG TPA: hypothetical protein VIS99_04105 [Terrimicrobiaceae bacterium]